jgi:hypothetical protein
MANSPDLTGTSVIQFGLDARIIFRKDFKVVMSQKVLCEKLQFSRKVTCHLGKKLYI